MIFENVHLLACLIAMSAIQPPAEIKSSETHRVGGICAANGLCVLAHFDEFNAPVL
ncbi:hypothetical protein KC216_21265 [Mycobacterium tuberculosis]|nr:hypothetical protein [Mycobacterium tuberculosis]